MPESSRTGDAGLAVPARIMVVDDDPSVREALANLLESVDFEVEAYPAPADFLASSNPASANCLILDVRMPMTSGFDVQCALGEAGIRTPVIFITGYGDIPMSVRAMKAGAVDFLAKPFRDQDLLDAVAAAVERDRQRRALDTVRQEHLLRFDTLSAREKQVMRLATSGLMNKEIAFQLGLSMITVKTHRGKVMRKMNARSFADLVRISEMLGEGGASG
ncbi:response regulator transcription factor (plasmid) [Paroceanicella profunda]|uniref:Response regulator transcription factor n=1 Tax=Paroceanicella profunda TaxID=2579971 RepID=A0A5B8G2S3_9RHOB|nr:response regulator [Paroceanicella profunda]QDL94220.1 response regulator transcription factor [Paroceanicella profunda]